MSTIPYENQTQDWDTPRPDQEWNNRPPPVARGGGGSTEEAPRWQR